MRLWLYEFILSLRQLRRRPTQTTLTIATFSVSIALSLVSWSLFHTMFLRNPEFDPQGKLYRVGQRFENDFRNMGVTRLEVDAFREVQTVFSEFAPMMLYSSTFVTTPNGVERLLSAIVSSEAFRMVGAQPLMGRLFTPEENTPGTAPVILLSERVWRARFDADPKVIGRLVKVDGIGATVVGVMPNSFRFPNNQEMWQPLGFHPMEKRFPATHEIVGRLKPGISPDRALDDVRLIQNRLGPASSAATFRLHPVIEPFRNYYLLPDMNRSALVLFALALVFVLVSCVNAANLTMIDFFGRTPEIASTLALGIPRAAAVRSLCFRLLVAAGISAVIGFGVMLAAAPYVHGAMERVVTPYWLLFDLQWHHFAMAGVLALISAAVAVLVPLGYLWWVSPEQIIRNGATSHRGTGRGVWRRVLLVGQIALLTVLAVSAGLLVRSSLHVSSTHWGFDAPKIFQSKTSMTEADFPTPEIRYTTHERLIEAIERIPGVAAAGVMTNPIGFSNSADAHLAKTTDGLADGRFEGRAVWSSVSPHLFAAFDVPFIEGTTFEKFSKQVPVPEVIINASLAQRLWPGQPALGRALFVRGRDPKQTPFQVVIRGVVRDFQASGPKSAINDFMYFQIQGGMFTSSFLYARGKSAVPTLDDIRGAARDVDPRMAIYLPSSVQRTIDTELSSVRLTTQLTFAYALTAVLLCAIGVYSITYSQVLQRNREFGIRMALGVAPRPLWARFARQYLIIAAIGVVVGVVVALAAGKVLQSLLFGVNEKDPITFALAATTILAVAALACIPSLFRLQRINPADCLRSL